MTNATPYYTLLDHTADLGIKVRGTDLKDLFKNAGKALMHVMLKFKASQKTDLRKIDVSGTDLADLMVRWLGEILYLFEGEDLVVTSIDIGTLSPLRLEAVLRTIPFDPLNHEILYEIKAVTYHQIDVIQKGNLWESRVIFDI